MSKVTHEDFGKLPEYRIGIIGARSSGKSNFMVAAVWQLTKVLAPDDEIEIGFRNSAEEMVYRQYVALLEQGLGMDQTSGRIPKAFTVSMRLANGGGCRLHLYDAAGEINEVEQGLASHPLEEYDAILIIVDPFAEEGARRGRIGQIDPVDLQKVNPASVEASAILNPLVNVLERVLKGSVGGIFSMPLAVVVTKIDACGLAKRLRLRTDWMKGPDHNLRTAFRDADRYSPRMWEFLHSLGLGNSLNMVESRFARVAYFPVSSLGRSICPRIQSPFQPFGVVAPLIWLCYLTDALSNRDRFEIWFTRIGVFLRRSYRGFKGPLAFWLAWSALACGALVWAGCLTVIVLCVTQVLPTGLMFVFPFEYCVFAVLPVILYHNWVRRRFRD